MKLCDFGLAIPLFPPPPAENCGTVRWTAPEINDSQGLEHFFSFLFFSFLFLFFSFLFLFFSFLF